MVTNHAFAEVQSLLASIFRRHGFSWEDAALLASNCATAEADGSASHGLFRMKHYVDTVRSGYADAKAAPVVVDAGSGVVRVDASNGFALVAIREARCLLAEKARRNGVAILLVRNSHHLGALYLDIEEFAREGFVAITLVNSEAAVAPPGAHRAVYGTNPMAFAVPCEPGGPVFFDQSSSTMALGEVQMAAEEGRRLPEGTGIDAQGRSTGDPHSILNGGALQTFGGHKGASIALMVEIMCAALGGGAFGYEVDWTGHAGAMTARTGETIVLIDPSAGSDGLRPFSRRVGELLQAVKEAGQDRVPGERRLASRAVAMRQGIPVDGHLWRELTALADSRSEAV